MQYKVKRFQQCLLITSSGTSSPLASNMKMDKIIQHIVTFMPEPRKIDFS
jgi:hypothetical protein